MYDVMMYLYVLIYLYTHVRISVSRIAEIEEIPPLQQHLTIHIRELPLLETKMLSELRSPTSSQVDTLDIQLAVVSEQECRGPFGVGQEHLWGVWEGMSNCSGVLGSYQGSWTCSTECQPLVHSMFQDDRAFVIDIAADLATGYYGKHFMFTVANGT